MKRFLLSIILVLTLGNASAQPPQLNGKTQLSLHGGLDYQAPIGDNIDLELGYGRFVADDLLLGGELQWSVMEDIAPGEKDYRSQQASFVAEWMFAGGGSLLPYVGAELGFRNSKFADLDESGLVYGGRIGARYFLADSVAIDASLNLLAAGKKVFIVDFEAEDRYVYPSLGIEAVF